jgi:aspartyl-tRNA(Asn)/glutamyl-tRNA(Gln) amidotransferase subunit C
MVEQMQAVDTSGIEPMSPSAGRDAAAARGPRTEADQRELFQAVAPQVEDGLYLVPQVIDTST